MNSLSDINQITGQFIFCEGPMTEKKSRKQLSVIYRERNKYSTNSNRTGQPKKMQFPRIAQKHQQ